MQTKPQAIQAPGSSMAQNIPLDISQDMGQVIVQNIDHALPLAGPQTIMQDSGQVISQYGVQNGWREANNLQQALAPVLYSHLAERFEPIMALAMHVRGTDAGRAMPWAEVAANMQTLADAEAAQALPEGLASGDISACRMAVYTFVDEMLLASPRQDETAGTGWYIHGLQLTRLGTTNGGELFYHLLSQLAGRANGHATLAGRGANAANAANSSNAGHQAEFDQGLTRQANMETRLLPALLDSLYPDQPRSRDAASALAAVGIFALCFLYGFRGRLYGGENARLAEDLAGRAASLLGRMTIATPAVELAPAAASGTQTAKKRPLPHLAVWLVLPVLLTVIWYFVCAEIVTNIPLP